MKRIYFIGLITFIHLSVFAQKMECKNPPLPKAETGSCQLKVETPETVIKDLADACKSAIDEGYSDDFVREFNATYGGDSSANLTPENLKSYIDQYKKSADKTKSKIEFVQEKLGSFDPEEQKKNQEIFENLKKDHEKKLFELEKDYHAASGDKRTAIGNAYREEQTNFEKTVEKLGVKEFSALQSDLINYKISLQSTLLTIDKYEMLLVAAETKTPPPVTEIQRTRAKEVVKSMANSIRKKANYVECGLTDIELFAIGIYTGAFYMSINSALRSNDPETNKRVKFLAEAINSGLEKLKPYEKLVRRGTTLPSNLLKEYCEGCVITMKAFTSTSAKTGFSGAQKFIISGKTAPFIAPLSNSESEQEVLFKSNTKFKILKINDNEYTLEEVIEKAEPKKPDETVPATKSPES